MIHRTLATEERPRGLVARVERLTEEVRPALESRGIRLMSFLDPDLPDSVPGEEAISTVLSFLLERTLDRLPFGTMVTVRSWSERDLIFGCVAHDGPPLRRREELALAGPIDRPAVPEGLRRARLRIEELAGGIEVDSRPDLWTRTQVYVPKKPGEAPGPEPCESGARATEGDDRGLRILIVEDDASVRRVVRSFLERTGHHVTEAAEGAAALGRVKASSRGFDRILLDMKMPDLGGEEVYRRLRDLSPEHCGRIIFMTGGSAKGPDAPRVFAETGAPVLTKPFRLAQLAELLEDHGRGGIEREF